MKLAGWATATVLIIGGFRYDLKRDEGQGTRDEGREERAYLRDRKGLLRKRGMDEREDQGFHGSDNLETGGGSGKGSISADEAISGGGEVWIDCTGSTRGRFRVL